MASTSPTRNATIPINRTRPTRIATPDGASSDGVVTGRGERAHGATGMGDRLPSGQATRDPPNAAAATDERVVVLPSGGDPTAARPMRLAHVRERFGPAGAPW